VDPGCRGDSRSDRPVRPCPARRGGAPPPLTPAPLSCRAAPGEPQHGERRGRHLGGPVERQPGQHRRVCRNLPPGPPRLAGPAGRCPAPAGRCPSRARRPGRIAAPVPGPGARPRPISDPRPGTGPLPGPVVPLT
jgi:hypothetical protein